MYQSDSGNGVRGGSGDELVWPVAVCEHVAVGTITLVHIALAEWSYRYIVPTATNLT